MTQMTSSEHGPRFSPELFMLESHYESIPENGFTMPTELIDQAVARVTFRLEDHLRLVIKEEMLETMSRIHRHTNAKTASDVDVQRPKQGSGQIRKADGDSWHSFLIQSGTPRRRSPAQPSATHKADAGSGQLPKKDGDDVIDREDSKLVGDIMVNTSPKIDTKILAKMDTKSLAPSEVAVCLPTVKTANKIDEERQQREMNLLERKRKAVQNHTMDLQAFKDCKGWITTEIEEAAAHTGLSKIFGHDHSFAQVTSPHSPKCLNSFVMSPKFDLIVAILLITNSLTMAIQLEFEGTVTAEARGYGADTHHWPNAALVFEILEHIFALGFALELVLRLLVHGSQYLNTWGNRLDASIVFQSLLELILNWVGMRGFANLSFLRLFRIIKLMKVLRIIRTMRLFRQLRILVHAIFSSLGALVWSMVLLFVIQLSTSIFMTQSLQSYLLDESQHLEDQQLVYNHFGTFARSYLTIFQITFAAGSWVSIGRLVIYKVSRWYALFFVIYCAGISFAMITVIRAIFLKETLACANSDDELVVAELAHQKHKVVKKLRRLFETLDKDSSGELSMEELRTMLKDPMTEAVFSTLEISIKSARGFFELIDHGGDNKLTFDEFLTGVLQLRGGTKNIDLVTCLFENKKLGAKISQVEIEVHGVIDAIYDLQTMLAHTHHKIASPSSIINLDQNERHHSIE